MARTITETRLSDARGVIYLGKQSQGKITDVSCEAYFSKKPLKTALNLVSAGSKYRPNDDMKYYLTVLNGYSPVPRLLVTLYISYAE